MKTREAADYLSVSPDTLRAVLAHLATMRQDRFRGSGAPESGAFAALR
jgi:hypothetical protein